MTPSGTSSSQTESTDSDTRKPRDLRVGQPSIEGRTGPVARPCCTHACLIEYFALGASPRASICLLQQLFRSWGRCLDPVCTQMHSGFARARGEAGFRACHAFLDGFWLFWHACHPKRARVAWLVLHRRKAGFAAAIGEAEQGLGSGLRATGTPHDTHADASEAQVGARIAFSARALVPSRSRSHAACLVGGRGREKKCCVPRATFVP